MRARGAAIAQDQKLTVGAIVDAYIEDRRKEGKKFEKMQYQWVPLKPVFSHLQPADLESEVLVAGEKRTICHKYAVDRTAAGMARDTVHSELNLVRTAINWAVARKKLSGAPHVWVPSAGKGRKTALTLPQIAALMASIIDASLHTRLLILVALATGARREAILELTWDRVDFVGRSIDFHTGAERSILDTGHDKGRAVAYIGDALLEVLAEAKEIAETDFVIEYRGKPIQNPSDGVKKVFAGAGLGGRYLGLHALRHTLATSAFEAGVDLNKIRSMLGHATVKTTEAIYIALRSGMTAEVARVADPHIKRVSSQISDQKSQAGLMALPAPKTRKRKI